MYTNVSLSCKLSQVTFRAEIFSQAVISTKFHITLKALHEASRQVLARACERFNWNELPPAKDYSCICAYHYVP